ncbi:MAG: 2OG-Fe(II) oxygenase family protein [Arenibacterium sp.]
MDRTVAIVNIAALFDEVESDARRATDDALWEGLKATGSVIITGYPQAEQVDARARTGLEIFSLSETEKHKLTTRLVAPENPNWYRGYWPMTPGRLLRNDFYDVGPASPQSSLELDGIDILTEPTPWPQREPQMDWARNVRAHYDHLNEVALAMIRSLGRSAGFDSDEIAARFEGAHSTLRFLNYGDATSEPVIAPDGTPLAAVRHTDASGLSLLWQDAPGLQAEGTDGRFRDIPPLENAISVHVGDVMTTLTRGVVPATPHRVLASDNPRKSVGFFLEPALDAPVTPADHAAPTRVEDTYAWSLLRTFAAREHWKGVIRDPATA